MSSPDHAVELATEHEKEGCIASSEPANRSEPSLSSPDETHPSIPPDNPEEGSRRSSRSNSYYDYSPVAVRSIIDWELGKREGNMDLLVSFWSDQIGSIINFIRIIFYTNPVDIVIVSLV